MTARRSLGELTPRGVMLGRGPEIIEPHQTLRNQEMMEVRAQIEELRGGMPLIVMGDFNTPVSSSLFRRWWSDLPSAFDTVGFGLGYTSPCRKNHRYWFDDTPWVRIDHVLFSPEWQAVSCDIGTSDGSDHRLIAAVLRLPGTEIPARSNAVSGQSTTDAQKSSRKE
jgi:endonuclease/exonuclease/phosphatase (EEP) superfamily protein YafD